MTDNEKLIAEAASIVYGTVPASVMVPWHELDTNRRVEFEDAARTIRAVFEKAHEKYLEREDAEYGAVVERLEAAEKAHTPTDDEREALIDVMVMTKLSDYAATDMSTIHQAVDAILAAGFRRSETDASVREAVSAERKAIASLLMSLGDRMTGEGTQAGYYAAAHEVRERERAALRAAGGVR